MKKYKIYLKNNVYIKTMRRKNMTHPQFTCKKIKTFMKYFEYFKNFS